MGKEMHFGKLHNSIKTINILKRAILTITILTFLAKTSFAQNVDLGSWNILNLKYNVDDKWSAFAEAQFRSVKFYSNFHYYELKGGFNYKFYEYSTFSLGAGSYQTYSEGGNFVLPKSNDEFRIWPQIVLFQSFRKLKIEQRSRAEFRFTNGGYRNRFRYRLGASYPLGKEENNYNPYQISASNELFFTGKEPYFVRNRMSVAFNYKPSKPTTFQVGYIHQFDYNLNDETGNDFLQMGLFIEISGRKTSSPNHEFDLKDD
jgi:hypothetical protein